MGDDIEPFVVIGELDGGHLKIAARSAPVAAGYWGDGYGVTAWWGLRHHTLKSPMLMIHRGRHGIGPGDGAWTVYGYPPAVGQFMRSEPAAYCGLRIPQKPDGPP